MKLKTYLETNNISYRTFAKTAGIHYSSISYFFSGRSKSISLDIAKKIVDATGGKVSFTELLEEAKTVREPS